MSNGLKGVESMNKKYIIGVDGGNTKTDYFLFDTKGNFVSSLRAGTCSHEKMKNGYKGAYDEMKRNINQLLSDQNLSLQDVVVGAFGLAGLDVPIQKQRLEEMIHKIGFRRFVADNDGYLGVKAGSENGVGICSINGTGTVTTGIDPEGNRLQIGGIGYISGDDAGGAFITRKLFREVYNTLYRCGDKTTLTQGVFQLLGVSDKTYYIQKIKDLYEASFSHTSYIQLVFQHALANDKVAVSILEAVAYELAKATEGCIQNLVFKENEIIPVILAGSVWVKPKETILFDKYTEYIRAFGEERCKFTILQVPPGIGAILWALELVNNHPVESTLRKQIIQQMKTIYAK